jgi:hypothetical protein
MPGRYLSQLCKHFEHKLPVTFDPSHGRIDFSIGPCDLDAATDPETLIMRVTTTNLADLATLEDVVARHLKRFAFREPPEIAWTRLT